MSGPFLSLNVDPQPQAGWYLCAGTVIPAKDSVYVASDINAFKARDASPTGGEGHFVVGPFGGAVLGPAASVTLANRQGDVIASN